MWRCTTPHYWQRYISLHSDLNLTYHSVDTLAGPMGKNKNVDFTLVESSGLNLQAEHNKDIKDITEKQTQRQQQQ